MSNFIEEIIDQAIINNWCVMPNCTTCGASKFKANLIIAASKKINLNFKNRIKIDGPNREYIAPVFHNLDQEELHKIINVIIKELTNLSKKAIMRHFSKSKEPYDLILGQIKMSGEENFDNLKYYSVGTPFSRFFDQIL
jgi:hypothetical protein